MGSLRPGERASCHRRSDGLGTRHPPDGRSPRCALQRCALQLSYREDIERVKAAYEPEQYEQLVALKNRYDRGLVSKIFVFVTDILFFLPFFLHWLYLDKCHFYFPFFNGCTAICLFHGQPRSCLIILVVQTAVSLGFTFNSNPNIFTDAVPRPIAFNKSINCSS